MVRTSEGSSSSSISSSVWKRKNTEMDQQKTHLYSTDKTTDQNNNNSEIDSKSRRKTKKSKRHALVSYEELPEYMKDNEFILNYYRANWPLREALFSIFRWHNETLNIWTHLIGFVLFLVLTVANLMHLPQVAEFITIFTRSFPVSGDANISTNARDFLLGTTKLIGLDLKTALQSDNSMEELEAVRWPFYVFLSGSMFCLLSSSTCHLFSCHSHNLNLFLLRIDYVGIAVMIITSFFPPIYYIFQCDAHWQFIYLGGITAMGMFTIITLLSPALSTPKYRPYRASLFVAMGLFGLVPAVHALVVNWNDAERNVTLAYESIMALSYLIGTMFYVCRIPERWRPGWFDLAGHSHQLFHVFVIMGALAHYAAALIFLEYRGKTGCGRSF